MLSATAGVNEVLGKLSGQIHRIESFVTADKTYGVYPAANEGIIRKRAGLSGPPANEIVEVNCLIDPTTERS